MNNSLLLSHHLLKWVWNRFLPFKICYLIQEGSLLFYSFYSPSWDMKRVELYKICFSHWWRITHNITSSYGWMFIIMCICQIYGTWSFWTCSFGHNKVWLVKPIYKLSDCGCYTTQLILYFSYTSFSRNVLPNVPCKSIKYFTKPSREGLLTNIVYRCKVYYTHHLWMYWLRHSFWNLASHTRMVG